MLESHSALLSPRLDLNPFSGSVIRDWPLPDWKVSVPVLAILMSHRAEVTPEDSFAPYSGEAMVTTPLCACRSVSE